MTARRFTFIDRVLDHLDQALRTALADTSGANRPNPAGALADAPSDLAARRQSAGLMRVNHAGEVCAQALYLGQAAVARDPQTRALLLVSAQEEGDHLAWCEARLKELNSRSSLLNPLWYAGSYAIGAMAGLAGDGYNLGFVMETERQVEAHLGDHLQRLAAEDLRSRAIVEQMRQDEVEHGEKARAAGGRELSWPWPGLMRAASAIMKYTAFRI